MASRSKSIAVLTPTLPSRGEMLAEAIASVNAQTVQPVAHLIGVDHEEIGIGWMLNRLAAAADTNWLARLDDDDLLDPNHLEMLSSRAADADVVYSWCRVAPRMNGAVEPKPPAVLGPGKWIPNQDFDAERLRAGNYIPATTLVRKSLWTEIGGWQRAGYGVGESPASAHGTEDWDFWLRALDAGARFACVPEITWTYRYHGDNVWFR